MNLRISKKGNQSAQGPPGDLMIQVKVKPHPYFRRDGVDINTDLYVTVSEAILGTETVVKTLYGDIKLKIDPGT